MRISDWSSDVCSSDLGGDTLKTLIIACLLLLVTPVLAAESKPAKPAQKTVPALNTNVIGSQEAPTVLNIVPWKDQPITLKQQAPTSRLLGQVLQPLEDRKSTRLNSSP